MNQTLEKTILGGLLVTTLAGFYISLDKAEKMTRVNPTNEVVFCYKTIQTTNEVSTTNTSYKN